MSKIIINSKIISNDGKEIIKDKICILKDNRICYNNNSVNVVVSIEENDIYIERNCDEYHVILRFNEGKEMTSSYFIKNLSIDIDVKTITKKLEINNNTLKIKYDLYMNNEFSDSFEYELEWRCL